MKPLIFGLTFLVLILTACAPAAKNEQMSALWKKYNTHCMTHAKAASTAGSPDVDSIYRECMDYFIKEDIECAYCVVGAK